MALLKASVAAVFLAVSSIHGHAIAPVPADESNVQYDSGVRQRFARAVNRANCTSAVSFDLTTCCDEEPGDRIKVIQCADTITGKYVPVRLNDGPCKPSDCAEPEPNYNVLRSAGQGCPGDLADAQFGFGMLGELADGAAFNITGDACSANAGLPRSASRRQANKPKSTSTNTRNSSRTPTPTARPVNPTVKIGEAGSVVAIGGTVKTPLNEMLRDPKLKKKNGNMALVGFVFNAVGLKSIKEESAKANSKLNDYLRRNDLVIAESDGKVVLADVEAFPGRTFLNFVSNPNFEVVTDNGVVISSVPTDFALRLADKRSAVATGDTLEEYSRDLKTLRPTSTKKANETTTKKKPTQEADKSNEDQEKREEEEEEEEQQEQTPACRRRRRRHAIPSGTEE